MKVLAIAAEGKEFLYQSSTAHKVPNASAEKIRDALNKIRYKLKDGQIWHIYEVSAWENAGIYAEGQKFTIRKGTLKEVFTH